MVSNEGYKARPPSMKSVWPVMDAAGLVITVMVPGFSAKVSKGLERVADAEAAVGNTRLALARGP